MKRVKGLIAGVLLLGVVAVGGAAPAQAASATWNKPSTIKKSTVPPMPDWGPGWCFVLSGGGWLGAPCR